MNFTFLMKYRSRHVHMHVHAEVFYFILFLCRVVSYLILSYPASLIPMINLTTVLSYFHFISISVKMKINHIIKLRTWKLKLNVAYVPSSGGCEVEEKWTEWYPFSPA